MEILLHQFSLVIGYAKHLLHQIRLITIFVSQKFSDFEVEFRQHAAEHVERHFAEEDEEVRHDGLEDLAEEKVRYNGQEGPDSLVRYNGQDDPDLSPTRRTCLS